MVVLHMGSCSQCCYWMLHSHCAWSAIFYSVTTSVISGELSVTELCTLKTLSLCHHNMLWFISPAVLVFLWSLVFVAPTLIELKNMNSASLIDVFCKIHVGFFFLLYTSPTTHEFNFFFVLFTVCFVLFC
jgi:hypothetical protein